MGEIDFNLDKVRKQAQEINEISNELKVLAQNEFSAIMQELSLMWRGVNASSYLRKGAILQEDMEKTVKKLFSIAENIRKTANILMEAETKAKQIVETVSTRMS